MEATQTAIARHQLYSVPELAKIFNRNEQYVYRIIRDGILNKIPDKTRTVYVKGSEVLRFLDEPTPARKERPVRKKPPKKK